MSHKEQHDEQRITRRSARATRVESHNQIADSQRGSQQGNDVERRMRPLCDHAATVLRLGAPSRTRRTARVAPPTARTQTALARRGTATGRNRNIARGDRRTVCREPRAKKGALALTPYRHYTADEKQELWLLVARAEVLAPERTRREILEDLGLQPSTFYRWLERADTATLVDAQVLPEPMRLPPTPDEIARVVRYAQVHPLLGYKRLTWAMVDENVACLRPWMVHAILKEQNLLGRRAQLILPYARPDEPDHPDQRWHTDLMSLKLNGRWFHLIDVLDAYRRYLVYWEVLLTARADVIVLATQRALETLQGRKQCGEPEIVHDRGPQFVGHEWRVFIRNAEVGDIPTRAHHPQSNGRIERFHRTTKEESLNEHERDDLYRARAALTRWQHYYNHERPHTALHYVRPIDYYRGDPSARLAEREAKLRGAAVARAEYWRVNTR